MHQRKIISAVLLACSNISYADELRLADIPVNANPIVESIDIDDYSSTSATVSEKQLKDLNAVDIAAALRTTPGVQISRFNPVGGYGGDEGGMVAIRGMGTSRPGSEIKTYIDGVPFYMSIWNHPLLDLLPVNAMSGITVYKSPQPQINGDNFASINLTTKQAPTQNGVHGETRMSAGSYSTVTEQATLYGRQDALDFVIAQGYATSDGHRANADGELKNLFGKVGLQINQNWRAEASFMYLDNYAKDPNLSNQYNKVMWTPHYGTYQGVPKYTTEASMFTVGVSHDYQNLSGEVKLYSNHGEGNWYNSPNYGPATMYNKFNMDGARIKEEISPWEGGHFKVGLDYDHIGGHLKGTNPYDPSSTPVSTDLGDFYITSPYLAFNQKIKLNQDWSLVPSAGVRYYEHNVYESKSAPHAGLSLVSDKLTVFANASKGINYVGLDGAALQKWGTLYMAPNSWKSLDPQELDHYEVGTKFMPIEATQIDVSIFKDDIKNRYMYNGMAAYAYMVNGYHINGAEVSIKQKLGDDWIAFVGYTYLDPSNDNLPYMPKNTVTLGVNGRIGDFKVALDAQHQSKMLGMNSSRFDANGDANLNSKVNSFTVANIRVSHSVPQLGSKGEVFLAVENIFNEEYEYVPGYEMPGTTGQVGFVANF